MESWFELDPINETTAAQGRLDSRTYFSRSFSLQRPNSVDDNQPSRFIYSVFDPESESFLLREADDWVLSETPAGRYQIKFLVAREAGNVKQIWIQRLPTPGNNGEIKTYLSLRQPEVGRLINLIKLLEAVPPDGELAKRVENTLIEQVLTDPDNLSAVYVADPEKFRNLIETDVSASDVLALAARRDAVVRFGRMLDEADYFDDLVRTEGAGSAERVWQKFFEANPWILGLSVSSQLFTSWDQEKLEQVVAGFDISGPGKRTDALMRTAGKIRSMVMVEIKSHRANLLHSMYRSGCWVPSQDLSGGVAQVQRTVHRAVNLIGDRIASKSTDGADIPNEFTYLVKPRSLLIIGRLNELQGELGGDHQDKVRSFELFRRSLIEPEVITFDELYAKALFIIEHSSGGSQELVATVSAAIQQPTSADGSDGSFPHGDAHS
jgi:hypothetical protein